MLVVGAVDKWLSQPQIGSILSRKGVVKRVEDKNSSATSRCLISPRDKTIWGREMAGVTASKPTPFSLGAQFESSARRHLLQPIGRMRADP